MSPSKYFRSPFHLKQHPKFTSRQLEGSLTRNGDRRVETTLNTQLTIQRPDVQRAPFLSVLKTMPSLRLARGPVGQELEVSTFFQQRSGRTLLSSGRARWKSKTVVFLCVDFCNKRETENAKRSTLTHELEGRALPL